MSVPAGARLGQGPWWATRLPASGRMRWRTRCDVLRGGSSWLLLGGAARRHKAFRRAQAPVKLPTWGLRSSEAYLTVVGDFLGGTSRRGTSCHRCRQACRAKAGHQKLRIGFLKCLTETF